MSEEKNGIFTKIIKSDLTRKYYWFIFTSLSTLAIVLTTSSVKEITKISKLHDPQVERAEILSWEIDTTLNFRKRHLYLDSIILRAKFPTFFGYSQYYRILSQYNNYFYEIHYEKALLEDFNRRLAYLKTPEIEFESRRQYIVQKYISREQTLDCEMELWKTLVEISLLILEDTISYGKNLTIRRENYRKIFYAEKRMYALANIDYIKYRFLKFSLKSIPDWIFIGRQIAKLSFLILFLVWVVVFILYMIPIGYSIWVEHEGPIDEDT